jgi:ferredoxin
LNLYAFYEASLPDESACNGCGTCVDYCPVEAIAVEEDIARIDGGKCIGCGQCEFQCSQNAIRMVENERTVFLPLTKRSDARIRE